MTVLMLIGLIVAFMLCTMLFVWACGQGLLGFFMARDLFDVMGAIMEAIVSTVAALLSGDG